MGEEPPWGLSLVLLKSPAGALGNIWAWQGNVFSTHSADLPPATWGMQMWAPVSPRTGAGVSGTLSGPRAVGAEL